MEYSSITYFDLLVKRWILLKNDVSRENVYRGALRSNGGTHFGTVGIALSCKSPTRDEWEKRDRFISAVVFEAETDGRFISIREFKKWINFLFS